MPSVAEMLLEPTGQTHPTPVDDGDRLPPSRVDDSLRRFTAAALAGTGVVLIPYLWVLLLCGEHKSLRTTDGGYDDNFYDLQARAILHGHLYLPNGSIGGEAFLHNGHQYTYFGLFPSLLRIPVLLVTHSLDGRLSALLILIAWLLTGLFTSLLVWRVRVLIRGPAFLGRAEAASLGVLMATIMGGSVLVVLAADPYVYSEDLAWSVALTTEASSHCWACWSVHHWAGWSPVVFWSWRLTSLELRQEWLCSRRLDRRSVVCAGPRGCAEPPVVASDARRRSGSHRDRLRDQLGQVWTALRVQPIRPDCF